MRTFCSFWLYPLLGIALTLFSARIEADWSWGRFGVCAAIGVLAWTLLEYCLHRFFFHSRSEIRLVKEARHQLHLIHHAEPRNVEHLFVRPQFSLPISALIFLGLYATTDSVLVTSGVLIGLWAGFLYYESVHYRLHLTSSQGPILAGQRRRHFHHHFVDAHRSFGVTSPLWDFLLGTRPKVGERISRKDAKAPG